MNYFAQGISEGARIGADSFNAKKQRDQQDKLEGLRRQLELDRDTARYKNEKDRQDAQLLQNAGQFDKRLDLDTQNMGLNAGFKNRDQAQTDRRLDQDASQFGQRLDLDTQNMGLNAGFKNRDQEHADKVLDQAAKQFGMTNDREYALGGAHLGLQAGAQAWKENPENPENKWRSERAAQVEEMTRPFAPPGAPAAPTGAKPAPNSAPKVITSKADYDALQKGERFVWNGKNGVKN